MAEILRDDIDWESYERQTEAQVKVRPASAFADQFEEAFIPAERRSRRPRMTSTKLRTCLDFRDAEVTVWAGYNGHRKSFITGQVMVDLCAQGERILAMSLEMLPGQTLRRQARQVYGMHQLSRHQREAFMSWTDGRLWVFDHLGRLAPRKAMAVLGYFAKELRGQHVFIDSMMMVCQSEESLDEQKQLMTDLVRVAQETGLHVHVVAHCKKPSDGEMRPPTKYDVRGSASITDLAHNIITVWANKAKKAALEFNPHDEAQLEKPDAMLSVEKQRNGVYEGKLKLWFDEPSGRFTDERTTVIEPFPIEEAA